MLRPCKKKAERQAKEKEQLAEKEKKQKEDPARAEAKKVTKAEEKNKEQPNIDNTVKEETVMVEESESTNETETPIQEEVAKEDFETEINTTDTQEETEIAEIEPEQALIKETAEELDLPKVPKGVVQQDNNYGTVRLAYDENAASFLLSIPTETKMHYHKDHSEHIMLIEGEGMVLMGYKTVKLKKNELLFITQGTPHKIINSGKDKLKVLSIQSPFYDGSDIIILE